MATLGSCRIGVVNPSPQQLAVGVAVSLLAAAAVVSPTNALVGNALVIWGSAFGALAAVLSDSPFRRAVKPRTIQLGAAISATGSLSVVLLQSPGAGRGGFHSDVMPRLLSGGYPTSPGRRI